MRRDEALDPRPPPGEFLFCLPVVGGHPTEEIQPSPFRIHAADIVLLPNRPSTVPFVVPEIKVPTSAEVADPSAAADLHFIPLSRGMPRKDKALGSATSADVGTFISGTTNG